MLEDCGYVQRNVVLNLLYSILFLFSIYKMADIIGVYNSLNTSIVTVMKNPETLGFVPDHLETKKMCKDAVKMSLSTKVCS